jgi:AraC family transcriptional regulator
VSGPAIAERPQPHTRQLLYGSLGISVVGFCCRAGVEPFGPEEPNPTHSIVFIRRGIFRRTGRDGSVVADPNHVLFFNANEPYRFSHPLPGGDDCTILTVDTGRATELVARHAPGDSQGPGAPFRLGHGLVTPAMARLHYELLARAGRPDDGLAMEDLVCELADEALRAAYRAHSERVAREFPTTAARRRRRELVEDAKLAINERLESPLQLGRLARLLGCSPFHLSHTFRRMEGLSLRRYTKRLRLQIAAERLAAGARDLTELALHLGYADHSHFTNAFRQEWGLPPSRFRANLRPGGRSE